MTRTERQVEAVHEAAHAVIARLYAMPVARVALAPDQESSVKGFCVVTDQPHSVHEGYQAARRRSRLQLADLSMPLADFVVVLLAGGLAAQRFTGHSSDGDWDDRLVAEQLLGEAFRVPPYGAVVHGLMTSIRDVADTQVRRHWNWIEMVAEVLLTRSLCTEEIDQLRPGRRSEDHRAA